MAYRISKIRTKIGFERAFALNKLIFGGFMHEGPESGNVLWLATDATGEAVGFASVRPTVDEPKAAFLSRVGVLSGHRRNGLHKRFLKVREVYCEGKFDYIWTYTQPWNLGSANNIIRQGYLFFDPWWGEEKLLYFKKELPAHEQAQGSE